MTFAPTPTEASAAEITRSQRRVWPFVVGTAVLFGAFSVWFCHHLWTVPIPDTMSDESSSMGEMIVLFLMSLGVLGCTTIGALLGWLIGWLVRSKMAIPSSERLVSTIFWTLWISTVSATTYALCVEFFGVGLFLKNSFKLPMPGEAHMAFVVSTFAIIGLMVTSISVARRSRSFWRLSLAAFAFWLFYLSIPRY
jgi:hypothetical protein